MKTTHYTRKIYQSVLLTLIFLLVSNSNTFGNKNPDKEKQPSSLTSFYNKFEGNEGVTRLTISTGLLNMFIDESDDEVQETLKSVTKLSLFVHDKGNTIKGLKNELHRCLPKNSYNDLMILKDGSETITFKIKESKNVVNELVLIVESGKSDEIIVISIEGKIPMDKVKKFGKNIKIDQLKGDSE